MKKVKITISVLTLCVLMATLAGCGAAEKKFEFEDYGFSITLTNEFVESEQLGQNIVLQGSKIAFLACYQSKSGLADLGYVINSAMDYANLQNSANNLNATPVLDEENNWVTFIYEKEVEKTKFSYCCYVIQSGNNFWFNQFCVETKNLEELKSEIEGYAKTITIEAE